MLKDVKTAEIRAPLIAGALSAVFYGSIFLMPIFLLPIGHQGARNGFKAMLLSAFSAILLISAWQLALLISTGPLSLGMLVISLVPPVILVSALTAIAMPGLSNIVYSFRVLGVTAIATIISLPLILFALKDVGTRKIFEEALVLANEKLGVNSINMVWEAMIIGLLSTYGTVLFAFLFISSWLAYRLGKISILRKAVVENEYRIEVNPAPYMLTYSVPYYLVWPLLISWAALLINRFYPSRILSAAALNVALSLSICYGVQGLAIVRSLAERAGLASVLRFLGPIIIILLFMNSIIAMIVFGLLVLLGTLETWIPFRTVTKGDVP